MMKRFIDKVLTAFFFAGVMLILASCVKEQFVDCPPDVRLLIKTDEDALRYGDPEDTRASSRAEAPEEWYNSIDSIDVYIFDENEKLVTRWKGGPYTPQVDYVVPLKEIGLREGVYTFVAWTNSDDDYYEDSDYHYYSNLGELMSANEPGEGGEEGEEVADSQIPERELFLSDMRMHMKHPEDRLYDEDSEVFPHRHHGMKRVYVSENSIINGDNVIEISPSIHKVNFNIIDANADSLSSRAITVIDNNASHDFHNRHIEGEDYHVRRPLKIRKNEESGTRAGINAPTMSASMYLMQLNDGTTTRVEIHNDEDPDNPELVYEVEDLVDVIRNAHTPGIGRPVGDNARPLDFEETLEFNVTMEVKGNVVTEFIVNGWRYNPQHIDM